MPIPQRHSRPRPSLYSPSNSLPTASSPLSPLTSTSLPKSTNPLKSLNIKPGYVVPRKTTLHFVASPREERVAIDEEDEGERRAREMEVKRQSNVEVEDVGGEIKKPVGLGELIAASKGNNRPPRAPIAHQLGFDLIPNPTNNVLIQEDRLLAHHPSSSSSPSSLPALSRSVATSTSTSISPANDFPDLPSARFPTSNNRVLSRIDSEAEAEADWDMLDADDEAEVEGMRESAAWVGIETGGNPSGSGGTSEDEELIFMDEESLMAMKVKEERARLKAETKGKGKGAGGGGEEGKVGRAYAQVLKGVQQGRA